MCVCVCVCDAYLQVLKCMNVAGNIAVIAAYHCIFVNARQLHSTDWHSDTCLLIKSDFMCSIQLLQANVQSKQAL